MKRFFQRYGWLVGIILILIIVVCLIIMFTKK